MEEDIYEKHLSNIHKHRELVYKVGSIVNFNKDLLLKHDLSKFSKKEFYPYAIYLFWDVYYPSYYVGSSYLKSIWLKEFNKAKKRHYRKNKHHWQHWTREIYPNVLKWEQEFVNNTLSMPEKYIEEMVIDWIASEIQNKKSINVALKLTYNIEHMDIHENSYPILIDILDKYGYKYNKSNGSFYYDMTNIYNEQLSNLVLKEISS